MEYRFRLTFHHSTSNFFGFDEKSKVFRLADKELVLTARGADTLSKATKFDFEMRGFPTEEAARTHGERLRIRLRILNSLLGLGMTIPTADTTSAKLADQIKQEMSRQYACTILDSIVGLAVYPDDDSHLESIVSGRGDVRPSDPSYLLTALSAIWPIDMTLDERSEDALKIVGYAGTEMSPRTKFLLTYLALERMVDRSQRSEPARALIEALQAQIRSAGIDAREADSLCGAVAQLNSQSFGSALADLAERISPPQQIKGLPLSAFLSKCLRLRNTIAHNAMLPGDIDVNELAEDLRHFVMQLIWTRNKIAPINVKVPPSTVTMTEGPSIEFR